MHCFRIFFKKFNKHFVNISRVLTKNTNSGENLQKFQKNFKKPLRKLGEILYFSIFFKRFKKPPFNYYRVWTKNTLFGKFEKFLKIFDKNSIGKLNFYRILEKLLLKIEPSEIASFFYNNFSHFGGGVGDVPLAEPMVYLIDFSSYIHYLSYKTTLHNHKASRMRKSF